jgi:sec-independent protein translocase protein TatA
MIANIFGPDGLIVLLVIVVLLFGAGQLPKLARSFGEAGKEFKKAQAEAEAEADALKRSAAATPVSPPVVAAPATDEKITLSKADLNALLDEREARAKQQTPPSA